MADRGGANPQHMLFLLPTITPIMVDMSGTGRLCREAQ